MAEESSKLATAKTILSTAASVAATAVVVRSVLRDYMPAEVQDYLFFGIRPFFNRFSNEMTMVIDEFDGLVSNEIYEAAECYLGPKITPATRRLKISKPEKEKNFNITMEKDQEMKDVYNGVKLKWVWVVDKVEARRSFYNPRDMNSTLRSEVRSFELSFHKKNKDVVINSYLPYIMEEAKLKKHEKKTVKLHSVDYERMYDRNNAWISVSLDHPATFDTLAMDSDQKDMILKDLERFVQRRQYYRKVGKAWKRGYLLYGPPGTGKSSLIAAMANFLNFDIYDLELTEVRRNSDLRKLLVATANKSILVVEDIDCTVELHDRLNKAPTPDPQKGPYREENGVTLSGFLNFIDGLWSSCGDERIIIFTTNNKEKLDPALLRPGRMDVHIHMSYCTPCGFRLLAANYLGLEDHSLFKDVEELIETTKITPAEVAEQLLKQNEPEASLKGLMEFLHELKRKESEEAEAKKVETEPVDKQGYAEQNDSEKEVRAGELVQINELIPAEVTEKLLALDEDALKGLVRDLVDLKTKENGEAKVEKMKGMVRSRGRGGRRGRVYMRPYRVFHL